LGLVVRLLTNAEKGVGKSALFTFIAGFSLDKGGFWKSYVLLRPGCEIEQSETIV
jgi:hypothetical protein